MLGRERPDALFVAPDAFFTERRVQLANLTARDALPASFAARENVEAGGLSLKPTRMRGPQLFLLRLSCRAPTRSDRVADRKSTRLNSSHSR